MLMNIPERLESAPPRIKIALAAILVAGAYYAGAWVGNLLSLRPDNISVLWPPNAIVLVALIRTPPRVWPVFLAATIPAEFAADLPTEIPVPSIIGFLLSDWIEVLIAAGLLRHFMEEGVHFRTLRNVVTYIIAAVVAGPLISAGPGAYSDVAFRPGGGGDYGLQFIRWFLSDGLTHLTVTPTLYLWLSDPPFGKNRLHAGRMGEIVILILALSLGGFLGVGIRTEAILSVPALLYIPLPAMLWAAVRFGPRSIFTAALFITVITILSTLYGYGPFTIRSAYSVLNLQFFLAVSLTPLIVLSVAIEEQKIIRRNMQESEERIRQITEFLPQTVFEVDRGGRLTYVNRNGLLQFGYDPSDLENGLMSLEVIAPADRRRAERNIARVLTGEEIGLNEYMACRKNGSEFPALMRSNPIVRGGKIVGLRGFAVDISERKQMEEDLRESEAKYRQILEHAPAGIYEVDLKNDRFIDFNEVWCNYTGYSRPDLMRISPGELLAPESRPVQARVITEADAGNPDPGPVEYEIRTREGRSLWVMVKFRFQFQGGAPKQATAVVHDITSKRRMDAERKALEERLQQAQKMESLGTLAGGIAHDFNNLLTGIQGNASLLRRGLDRDHPHYDRLNAIEDLVQRAASLTGQLLGLARGGKYEVKPTDINELVLTESELFGRTRKEIEMQCDMAEDTETVEVDRGQIEQVLLNLFVNAWQAMPDGGMIRVETRSVSLDERFVRPYGIRPGRYVRVSVEDTGIGMDTSTQRKIFDPFFTTKETGRGTGLGLASAYGIIKNHGGIIDVSSSPGKGARFDIYLPVSGRPPRQERKIVEFPAPGKGTILLIDDEKMIRDVGMEMLAYLGYQVLAAPDGDEGIAIYEKEQARIDLVILDMIMPKTSGAKTYERLKAIDPEVRVLLSSGYSRDGQAAEILSRGCDGFIQKPFTLESLSEKILEVLDPSRS